MRVKNSGLEPPIVECQIRMMDENDWVAVTIFLKAKLRSGGIDIWYRFSFPVPNIALPIS
jgi:hypothetical protein